MFKIGVLFLSLISTQAFAGIVGLCSQDPQTSADIAEIDPSERLDLVDNQGNVVGALIYDSYEPTKTLYSLYLCGSSEGYFYVDAELADWVSLTASGGDKVPVAPISNGTYSLNVAVEYWGEFIKIYFQGAPQRANFTSFAAEVFVKVPENRPVPTEQDAL